MLTRCAQEAHNTSSAGLPLGANIPNARPPHLHRRNDASRCRPPKGRLICLRNAAIQMRMDLRHVDSRVHFSRSQADANTHLIESECHSVGPKRLASATGKVLFGAGAVFSALAGIPRNCAHLA